MSKIELYFYQHVKLLRRIVQIATILLIIAIPVLNTRQITFILGTFYSLSIGHLEFADPTLVLQTILLHKSIYFPLILAGTLPLLIAIIFGRVFCGWICPFNAIAEFVYWLKLKLKRKKYKSLAELKNPRPHYFWISLGVSITIVMVLGIPFMSYISAPGIISSQIADAIFTRQIGWELSLIVFILIVEFILFRRLWCKYVCPIGIFISLFRYRHTMEVKFDPDKCTGNEKVSLCNAVCKFDLNPKKAGTYPYCVNCGDCVDICQRKYGKALTFTFHRKVCE